MKIEKVTHEVIEKQCLVALDNKDKVALVITEEDLDEIIRCLGEASWSSRATSKINKTLLRGLNILKEQAFAK